MIGKTINFFYFVIVAALIIVDNGMAMDEKAIMEHKIAVVSEKIIRSQNNAVLPEKMVQKLALLYNEGKREQVAKIFKAINALQKLYWKRKCYLMFSSDVCENSSAQPFFLWAKMYANRVAQKSNQMVRSSMDEIIRRG